MIEVGFMKENKGMMEPPKNRWQTNVSRGPGNEKDRYDQLAALAESDPKKAMEIGLAEMGSDGSDYAAISCNISIAIGYARLLEHSDEERRQVRADPLWEGYPPDLSLPLFVALRKKYWAGRTKTAAYERARIHHWAMYEAYCGGIRPSQVRSYLSSNKLEALYDRSSQTPIIAPLANDGCPSEHQGRRILPDISVWPVAQPQPVDLGGQGKDPPRLPPASSLVPDTPRRRVGKYDIDVSDFVELGVLVPRGTFGSLVAENAPVNFVLSCNRAPNGEAKWIAIFGQITW